MFRFNFRKASAIKLPTNSVGHISLFHKANKRYLQAKLFLCSLLMMTCLVGVQVAQACGVDSNGNPLVGSTFLVNTATNGILNFSTGTTTFCSIYFPGTSPCTAPGFTGTPASLQNADLQPEQITIGSTSFYAYSTLNTSTNYGDPNGAPQFTYTPSGTGCQEYNTIYCSLGGSTDCASQIQNLVNPTCPTGDGGTYPNCTCPAGYTGSVGPAPTCVIQTCPVNSQGTAPNCTCKTGYAKQSGSGVNIVCKAKACSTLYANTTGTYPSCSCASGYTGSPGSCTETCAAIGEQGTYPNCGLCPSGDTGSYPSCSCPAGDVPQTGPSPSCVPLTCAYYGAVGTYPNCSCPSGYIGSTGPDPSCTDVTCPSGYSGIYPNCVKQTCPAGGTPPNCVASITCATLGEVGTYPNCSQPACPTGQIGNYPNCYTPVCPTGETGTYPNCVAPTPVCPTGYTGTPPNCTQTAPTTCPYGFTGTPPNCVPPAAQATGNSNINSTYQITESNLPQDTCNTLAGYMVNPDQVGVSVNGSRTYSSPMTLAQSSPLCMSGLVNTVTWTIK
jgi:hypothetical protein